MKKKTIVLTISSLFIFSFWLVMIGFFVNKNLQAGGVTITIREMASYKPPVAWQWSGIYQNNLPVGISAINISEEDLEGVTFYNIHEVDKLITISSGIQIETSLQLDAKVDDQFALQSFSANVSLNKNHFEIDGRVSGQKLYYSLIDDKGEHQQEFILGEEIYLPLSFTPYLASYQFEQGKEYVLKTFDPLSLGLNKAKVKVLEKLTMDVLGEEKEVKKLEINLADIISYLYIDDQGMRVKEEIPENNLEARAIDQKEYYEINKILNIENP